MEVEVNGEPVKVFSGARVRHAIMSYSLEDYRLINAGKRLVVDEAGNEVQLGGELTGREKLTIVEASGGREDLQDGSQG